MMEKFAEDDRLDQLNARVRKLKQQEHRKEVEKLIEERKQQKLEMVWPCNIF